MTTRRLFWRQGLFLAPQHFQYFDARADGREAVLRAALHPHAWGVRSFRLRTETVAGQHVLRTSTADVLGCEIVFPDSGPVLAGADISGTDIGNAVVLPRSFKPYLDPAGRPLGVYLGLPRLRDDAPNVAEHFVGGSAADVPPRFTIRDGTLRDRFDATSPDADMPELFSNVVLLFSSEPKFELAEGNYELIHVADVAAMPSIEGAARVVSDFYPPSLRVSAVPRLDERLRTLRDLLVGKAEEFSALKRDRGIRATTTGSQDAVRIVILQTLNRFAVRLEHLLAGESCHPWLAYQALRELVAEFSVFSEQVGAFGQASGGAELGGELPDYRHDASAAGFDRAIDLAQELARAVSAGPEAGIALMFENGFYKATLPENLFDSERSRYYLLIESSKAGADVEALIQRTGKICNLEIMNQVRQFATTGAKVSYLPVPPEDLPQRGGNHHYFQIDTSNEVWRRVRAARNLAVLCDLPPGDTAIKLVCVGQD
jgi:type VI secretion system protein ImpJ